MRKIVLFTALSLLLAACSKQDNGSVDALIQSNNLEGLKAKRAALQADITKIDEKLGTLEKKSDEALVSVLKLSDTIFNHFLEIQGNVDTKENLVIYPQYSGTLVSLNVVAGQKVTKGQVLGRIDDGGLGQQVAQLEAQLALAKTTYERQKRLWDQKIGSEIQYLQAQTTMVSQQKAVAQIKAQYAKTVVTAPISGTVDEIITDKGEVVSPTQGIVRIVNLSNMYISTSVPESYIGKLNVGTPVDIELTSLGKNYVGKVRQVANNINPNNRTFGIEVSVPNTDKLLRPNQVAKLKVIDYTNKNTIVVPTNVIQQDAENNKFVFVANNINGKTATAKKALIKVGQSAGNVTEILSGLNDNDVIVVEGANAISEGMKLNF
ncbi:efflux RND transporter periplasmic adaptor subunit [Flavobacterium sp.]|uniref:efflux RND transporter periplasmic adaptor subunit n=1 Tax=Flavobacterium sp. TaxID=239 RepID=UPI0039E5E95E